MKRSGNPRLDERNDHPTPPRSRGSGARHRPARWRFGHDEDGALVVFSMLLLVAVLIVTGLGLDLMRTETTRAKLQATADRAVLAAAAATQPREPEQVVRDYFAAAGLEDLIDEITITDTNGLRAVKVTTRGDVGTSFLRLIGIESFPATALAEAKEAMSNLELSLVVDISGSMSNSNKIDRLKEAASEFVDTVFAASDEGATTISLVPFSSQVNVGETLLSQFNVSNEHNFAHCVDFTDADFTTTAITVDQPLQRSGYFDPFSHYSWGYGPYYTVCRNDPESAIVPLSSDPQALKDAIAALDPYGNTSLEIGAKWGAALLDPAARPAVEGLIAAGMVHPGFDERPHDFTETGVKKVMILMTDGENTTEYVLKDEFRDGLTDVWWDPATGRFSIWGEQKKKKKKGNNGWGNGDQCAPGNSSDRNNAENAGGTDPCENFGYFTPHNEKWQDTPIGGDNAVRLTYPELWSKLSVGAHAYMRTRMTGKSSDYDYWRDVVDPVYDDSKDDRTLTMCQAAKDAGITVYTIGFRVSNHAADILEQCATSPSHFFRVESLDIAEAFRAIAGSINVLRLTQ